VHACAVLRAAASLSSAGLGTLHALAAFACKPDGSLRSLFEADCRLVLIELLGHTAVTSTLWPYALLPFGTVIHQRSGLLLSYLWSPLPLAGPPGCGKSSVLSALAPHLGFELSEWRPPSVVGWDEAQHAGIQTR
jgi:hypothetical protein